MSQVEDLWQNYTIGIISGEVTLFYVFSQLTTRNYIYDISMETILTTELIDYYQSWS